MYHIAEDLFCVRTLAITYELLRQRRGTIVPPCHIFDHTTVSLEIRYGRYVVLISCSLY